ncbi:MAG TPA: DUF4389 domain-containing protein [Gaiellales bacterium]|nr:DUF4389 domain-containing protein [Gaiellales bacterium]
MDHPVHVRIEYRERRSRLTAALRFFLALPHLVAALAVGLAATAAVAAAWVSILATGRSPRPLAGFVAGALRYTARVGCYWLLVTDGFPSFSQSRAGGPVDVSVEEPAARSRLTTLCRLPLAVPALVLLYFLQVFALLASFVAWWTILITARMPSGMFEVMEVCQRFQARVWAYLWLLTDAYPWFQEERGSGPAGWGIQAEIRPSPE